MSGTGTGTPSTPPIISSSATCSFVVSTSPIAWAKTEEEIAIAVLRDIGELGRNQTASGEDLQICIDAYREVWSQLQNPEFIANWGAADSVPAEAVPPIVALVEASPSVIAAFSISGETLQRVYAAAGPNGETAKGQLRSNIHNQRDTANAEPTEMEYM